jgi:hypothetical protein
MEDVCRKEARAVCLGAEVNSVNEVPLSGRSEFAGFRQAAFILDIYRQRRPFLLTFLGCSKKVGKRKYCNLVRLLIV